MQQFDKHGSSGGHCAAPIGDQLVAQPNHTHRRQCLRQSSVSGEARPGSQPVEFLRKKCQYLCEHAQFAPSKHVQQPHQKPSWLVLEMGNVHLATCQKFLYSKSCSKVVS